MTEKKVVLTYDGLKNMEAELENLKTVRRKDVAEKIKEARGQGDLSENAEYDAAKEEQAEIEARIVQLEKMLRNAEVIDEEEGAKDTISLGTTVTVLDVEFDEEMEYTIVGSAEADPMNRKNENFGAKRVTERGVNSAVFREKCGENMQSLKKIIYKVPIIDKLIKKWEKCNNEITKLRSENKELKACIQKMSFEVRRNEVFREIDNIHFRKVQRDMEAMCHPERSILKQAHPLVSIIIVNHNGKSQLSKLLKSLHERTFYDNFEIIMVDNASEDESLDIIKEYQALLPIKVIRNDENLSFSAANNIGANYAEGEYLLFLNNDTEVTDGWLDELLLSALNNENVGAIGATLVYPEIPNYSINKGKSYTIQHEGIAFRDGIRENIRYWQPYNVNNGEEMHVCMSREDHEWACVTAAVLLVRKQTPHRPNSRNHWYLWSRRRRSAACCPASAGTPGTFPAAPGSKALWQERRWGGSPA